VIDEWNVERSTARPNILQTKCVKIRTHVSKIKKKHSAYVSNCIRIDVDPIKNPHTSMASKYRDAVWYCGSEVVPEVNVENYVHRRLGVICSSGRPRDPGAPAVLTPLYRNFRVAAQPMRANCDWRKRNIGEILRTSDGNVELSALQRSRTHHANAKNTIKSRAAEFVSFIQLLVK